MGQRLNIEIIIDGKTQANAYYHWSGYTGSALQLTTMILEGAKEVKEQHPLARAVKLLEITGAGVLEEEMSSLKEKVPNVSFAVAKNRNEGLISITEEGMENTRGWEEARVEIDFDKNTVDFQVFYKYDAKEYMNEMEVETEEFEEIPIVNYEYDEMDFDKFKDFAKHILDIIGERIYAVKTSENEVISFIE